MLDPDNLETIQEVSIANPLAVDFRWVDNNYYALITTQLGDIVRINFGNDFTSTGSETFENLGNFGLLSSPLGFRFIRNKTTISLP